MADENEAGADSGQAKIEYDRLTSFFKYLVTVVAAAITLLLSAGVYLLGRSIGDIKSEANSAIAAAAQKTASELVKVREEARDIALGEARRHVQAAFEEANVTLMVEQAAQRRVGSVIDRQIKQEVAKTVLQLQNEIAEIGEVANLAMQARVGKRRGLDNLAKVARNAKTERGRQAAGLMHDSIIADYRESYDLLGDSPLEAPKPNPETLRRIAYLVQQIRTDQNLDNISMYFDELMRTTGVRFKILDFEALENWCKTQKHACKQ